MSQRRKFEVTKDWLQNHITLGYTIADMAEKLTEMSGKRCSELTVRNLIKHYNLNARKKTRSFFVPTQESTESSESTITTGVVNETVDVDQISESTVTNTEESVETVSNTTVEEVITDDMVEEPVEFNPDEFINHSA